jgi:hypothetical protein
MTFKRITKATVFILLHALVAAIFTSVYSPSWTVSCGIIAAAFATLFLILFAGDETSARLFFFENWDEITKTGTPVMGLIFTLIGCIWFIPVLCLFFTLALLALRWLLKL